MKSKKTKNKIPKRISDELALSKVFITVIETQLKTYGNNQKVALESNLKKVNKILALTFYEQEFHKKKKLKRG